VTGRAVLYLNSAPSPDDALRQLAAHDYSDLPDFSDWLEGAREARRAASRQQLRAELDVARTSGDVQTALDLCTVLLDLDPLNEALHRLHMQLCHLQGDRTGALDAYHRWQELLSREMGLKPAPETAALARTIAQTPPVVRPVPDAIPLSVQRPPRLIGRDSAWQAMERAWAEGKGIILSGAPGVGKTRLMRDFVSAHGKAIVFEGRPGDRLVPYSTHARTYRALLRQWPGLELPAWVRRELSRLVPELGDTPGPITNDAEKLRFYQAKTEVLLLAARAGMEIVALDDLQFVDEASVEAGEHSLSVFWGDGQAGLRTIHVHRSGELSPALETRIDELVAAGLAVRVRLAPLGRSEVTELLGSLDLPALHGQEAQIALVSGGNPLVVLETARHLLSESSAPAGASSGSSQQPLSRLLTQRLERLSPAAVSLARVSAVLGSDLSPEGAAAMLGCTPLELAAPWTELEGAQVLAGRSFTHDLVQEAILQGLPDVLRELLHRQAATALDTLGADPARIGTHWDAGKETARAAPHWAAAARQAERQFRLSDAAQLYGRAARAYEAAANVDAAIEALEQQSKALLEADHGEQHGAVVARIERLARTPVQRARAAYNRAQLQNRQRDGAGAEATARSGLALLEDRAEPELRASLLGTVALSLWYQGQLDAAAELYAQAEVLFGELGLASAQADTINDLALVLDYQARRSEAAQRYRQVERLFETLGQTDHRAIVLGNWGGSLAQGGRAREAVERLQQALELCQGFQGTPNIERRVRTQLGGALTALGRYREAREHLTAALALAQANGLPQAYARTALADLWASLGRDGEAQTELDLADSEHTRGPEKAMVQLSRIRAADLAGRRATGAIQATEDLIGPGSPATSALRLRLWQTRALPPRAGFDLALKAVQDARMLDHGGLEAVAHVRAAQALLALGEPAEALIHTEEARALLEVFSAIDVAWTEMETVRLAALEALGDPAAGQVRAEALTRLLRMTEEQVPAEDRSAFLARPHSRTLLDRDEGVPGWMPLTDLQWAHLQEVLNEPEANTGRPRRDTRAVLDGVLWALATGATWNRPFPAHLPSAATCYRRYRAWNQSGTLRTALQRLSAAPGGHPLAARLLAVLER